MYLAVSLPSFVPSFASLNPCVAFAESIEELERAVGPWPWRIVLVQASASKPISRETTLLLALVTFAGFELFPGKQ